MLNSRFMTIFTTSILALLVVYAVWVFFRMPPKPAPKSPPPRKSCSVKAAKEYRTQLAQLRTIQQWKAQKFTGDRAKHASWIEAKIGYALMRAKDDKALNDPNIRNFLEDTYIIVLRAKLQADQGADKLHEEWGGRLRTYDSPIDNTTQTYSVSVPQAYDPNVKWPLIVNMHGHGWYAQYQGHPAPTYSGAICLSPQGRGSNDYKDLGEDDVLEAIRLVKEEFNIDEDRVYLTGGSMGGTGSFHLGVHYADQFAAIFPIVGNADNLAWTERWGWNRLFPGRFDNMRTAIQESHTARAFVDNLFNLPSFILCGSGDVVVPPAHSRNMVEAMRKEGFTVEYREYPGVGHGGFPWDIQQEGLAWACGWKRNPYPRSIHWKTSLLKHGKAYWVRIDQLQMPLEFGEIRARAQNGTQLVVATANVNAFSFQKPSQLFEQDQPLLLFIDGQGINIPISNNNDQWIQMKRDPNHGWRRASDVPLETRFKKVGCEGPIHEVFMQPFAIVIGTQNPSMEQAWMDEAERIANDWKRRYHGYPRILLDSQVNEEHERTLNLLLLGGAQDNLVSERQSEVIPWSHIRALLESANFELNQQQNDLMNKPDVGTMVAYPNVSNPDKMSVIWTANSPGAAYQAWGRFGNWFNWGVFDSKKYFDYAVYDQYSATPETMLLIGWFGHDWEVPTGKYFFGNPTLREAAGAQGYPEYDEPPANQDELLLVNLKPTKIDQMRGAIGLGRTFFGEPMQGGIGLRAPAVIEYNIDKKYNSFTSDVELQNPNESHICHMREKGEAVNFIVWGDGKKLAEAKVDWKKPTATINANLSGVKVLKLETQPAGGPAWLHMSSAWLKPTLSTAPQKPIV